MKTHLYRASIIWVTFLFVWVITQWCLADQKVALVPENIVSAVDISGKLYKLEVIVIIACKSLKSEGIVMERGKALVTLRFFPGDGEKFFEVCFLQRAGQPGYSVVIDNTLTPQKATRVDVAM